VSGGKEVPIETLQYIIMHPVRRLIVRELLEAERSGEKLYTKKIAERLAAKGYKVTRDLVAHHIDVLNEYGLVESEYGIRGGPPTDEKGRPVVVAYHKLTQRAKEALKGLPI